MKEAYRTWSLWGYVAGKKLSLSNINEYNFIKVLNIFMEISL